MADDTEAPPAPESTNTGQKQGRKPGTFTKNDPRINRNGRPRSFDALRKLAQQIAVSHATKGSNEKLVIDGHLVTNAEAALLKLMQTQPDKFLTWAYGAPPPPAPVNALQSIVGHLPKPYLDRILAGEPVDVVFAAWASEQLAKKE